MSMKSLTRSLCLATAISGWTASARDGAPDGPQLRAWVLSPDEGATAEWLARAGFTVATLPLERSPTELSGLVVLGAEASDMPEYHAYMHTRGEDLADFVEQGGVLLQLAQDAEVEPTPPFLPATLAARRGPVSSGAVHTLGHPLLTGMVVSDIAQAGDDGFAWQVGFMALIAGADGDGATLLAGSHGRGEVLLVSLPLDRPHETGSARDPLADAFATNLAHHVACLQSPGTPACGSR